MASESSSERVLSLTIPADLDEWLDQQAVAADVDREQFLLQLLVAFRRSSELESVPEELLAETLDERIEDAVAMELEDELDGGIDSRIETALDERVTQQISEATSSVQRQLSNRIESVEAEFDEKITDVRERVIQVKKETDAKAPADHDHAEFDELEELSARIEELETQLDSLSDNLEDQLPENERMIEEADERLARLEERLQTVAWVVSDLRDAHESTGGLEAVERIKRAAARESIERANCESCGETVVISLLTDPECPHCNATVTNVEAGGGWFSKPKLLAAKQLESGEDG